jgi:hypothetical protein
MYPGIGTHAVILDKYQGYQLNAAVLVVQDYHKENSTDEAWKK